MNARDSSCVYLVSQSDSLHYNAQVSVATFVCWSKRRHGTQQKLRLYEKISKESKQKHIPFFFKKKLF